MHDLQHGRRLCAGATMLLAHAGAVTTYPHLYPKLAYDAAADLVPVSLAADTGFALAVGAAVPADVRTLDAFIGWSRAHPALSNHGSPGQGTLPHLLGAMLFRQAGVAAQHVTYPGGPLAIQDLLGGRLAALVLPEGLLRPLHLAGKARLLATSGAARSRFLPEVPTFAEQGYPALATREWFGFFVPAETPDAAVAWAAEAVRTAAARPPLLATLGDLGMQAVVATPAAMAERIASERRAWQAVIATMGIRLE